MDFSPEGYVSPCNHFWRSLTLADETFSMLELWNGAQMRELRERMINYTVDQDVCCHCITQIGSRQFDQAFSVIQFDDLPATERSPRYPKRLIFRLGNTCNLACIMCNGETSSRIRREFDKQPPVSPVYGERFFQDLEEILPHVEHVQFFGGEPFLVREHIRVFELIEKTKAQCSIYVNTNATSLNRRTREFLERLNFTCIAISMDAVSAEVHEKIRYGLRSKVFYDTVAYFLDLRERRGLFVMLNVTEHRKNWFEIPEVFRFAQRHDISLHINTCIHPENVTLYTLPTDQLQYVLDFTLEERARLCAEFGTFKNLPSYDFYISLIRGELENRDAEWKPKPCSASPLSDGVLATPIPGLAPFDSPERVIKEAKRMRRLDHKTRCRMLAEMGRRIQTLPEAAGWGEALKQIEAELGQPVESVKEESEPVH
jgi:sulfatase maturation enzyme AslB (radical SAM superfamily)